MPHTKSAKKRLRTSTVRRESNRGAKRTLKTLVRKVVAAAATASPEQVSADARVTIKKLDQAAAKKVIHRNAAARQKSRLSARLKAAKKKA
jgi:small subunit ribosomal protein S20